MTHRLFIVIAGLVAIGGGAGWLAFSFANASPHGPEAETHLPNAGIACGRYLQVSSPTDRQSHCDHNATQTIDQAIAAFEDIAERYQARLPRITSRSGQSVGPVSFDVRTADSLVSPYEGQISFRTILILPPVPDSHGLIWEQRVEHLWTVSYRLRGGEWILSGVKKTIPVVTCNISSTKPGNEIGLIILRAVAEDNVARLKSVKDTWSVEELPASRDIIAQSIPTIAERPVPR